MTAAVDLTVADTGFAASADQPVANPGAHFVIRPTLQENGASPTHSLPYAIYLSPTPSLTDQSVLIYSSSTSPWISSSGTGWEAYATGTLPSAVAPGTWYPIVVVDPNNVIAESDETNNMLVGDPATVALPHDDLVPPVTSSAGPWRAGTAATIYSLFPQDGRSYPVAVAYSLSTDDISGNSDDIPLGTFTHPYFSDWTPAHISVTHKLYPAGYLGEADSVPLPADLAPGTYRLVTTIDPDHATADPDRSNNSALGPTITILPADTVDLTVGTPLVHDPSVADSAVPSLLPVTPTPGSHIRVGAIPLSVFGQPIRPKVAFVLSADDTYGNADDILLGSYDTNATTPTPPGLIVCFAFPTTIDVTLPSTLAPGHYKLFAVVDADNQLAEYDESNNVSAATDLTVFASAPIDDQYQPPTSDPTATSPNTPTPTSTDKPIQVQSTPTFRNVTAGSSAKTSVTLANPTGKSLTATYKVTFYLSTDPTLSRTDKAIGSQTFTITLRPHQTKSPQLTYRIPPTAAAGQRYLITTLTPLRTTRITTEATPPTPLKILPKPAALKSLPISRQILESRQDR